MPGGRPDHVEVALRTSGSAAGGCSLDGPAWVRRVDPPDGATGVFRDTPVVLSLSHPAQPASVSGETMRVYALGTPVTGRLALSPDRSVVIWTPSGLLRPDCEHVVWLAGVRDGRGREVSPHTSRFFPGRLALEDLLD